MIKELIYTPEIANIFKDINIYFTHSSNQKRFELNTVLVYESDQYVEEYIGIYQGLNLPSMGFMSYTNSNLPLKVKVGRFSSIANRLRIAGNNHPYNYVSSSPFLYNRGLAHSGNFHKISNTSSDFQYGAPSEKGVVIENDVWIGDDVLLMQGVKISNGSVIAAGSVITKDVEPYAIVGGVPAKKIKLRFSDKICQDLLDSKWWDIDPKILTTLPMSNPIEFIKSIKGLDLNEYSYKKHYLKNYFDTEK